MSDEKEQKEPTPKGQTTVPDENPQPQQTISIQEIMNNYPIDRDKCRDVIMIENSAILRKISESLEAISQSLIVTNTHLNGLKTKV